MNAENPHAIFPAVLFIMHACQCTAAISSFKLMQPRMNERTLHVYLGEHQRYLLYQRDSSSKGKQQNTKKIYKMKYSVEVL